MSESRELTAEERAVIERFEASKYPPQVALELLIAELRATFEPVVARAAKCLARLVPGDPR
jgi:hypothetical protein